jgi:hypothetical protein
VTESQWFAGTNPHEMLAYLKEQQPHGLSSVLSWFGLQKSKLDVRKLRLFAFACCRRIWPLLDDERSRQAVEIGEQYLDGAVDKKAYRQAAEAAHAASLEAARPRVMVGGWMAAAQQRAAEAVALALKSDDPADDAATCAKDAVRAWASHVPSNKPIDSMQRPRLASAPVSPEAAWIAEGTRQCELLRDLIGNPFRPPSLDASWRTPQAVALAKKIAQDHAFADMPQLADTLEQAGCKHPEVLQHCRDPKEHARGCWVLDFILAK